MVELYSHEELEDLNGQYKIIQSKNLYRFSEDPFLLAEFIDTSKAKRIVDLGTGSGILLFLLAIKIKDFFSVGVEIQHELFDMARRSVLYNNLGEKIKIIKGDLKEVDTFLEKNTWDLVVSNPPYFKKGHGRMSPKKEIRIARQEIACTLKDVVEAASYLLKPKGIFGLVHLASRLPEIIVLLKENNLEPQKMQLVASGKNKKPHLVLLQSVKNSTPEFLVLPQKNLGRDSEND